MPTIGEQYGPAMKITDQAEADAYFERLVSSCMAHGKEREEAVRIQKANLGYFAGYYDDETRRRVKRLFRCSHPVFGSIAQNGPPTADQALEAGKLAGLTGKMERVGFDK